MAKTPQFVVALQRKIDALIDWELTNRPGASNVIPVNVSSHVLHRMVGIPTDGKGPKEVLYRGRVLRAIK